MNLDDFKHLLSHLDIKAESKKPSEDPHDAKLRRFKDKWLFIATLIAIAIVFGTCIGFLLLKQDSPYTGIALNGVIGLAMALAGYYVRGKTN
jgi:hypothetical protein